MPTILIDPGLGVTYDNMPESVFQIMTGGPGVNGDGGPRFMVSDRNAAVEIITHAARQNGHRVEVRDIGQSTTVIGAVNRETVQTDQAIAPANDRAGQATIPVVEAVEDMEGQELEDDDEDGGGRFIEVTTEKAFNQLDKDGAAEMIAAAMENELSSKAKNLHEKNDTLTKLWTKAISLRREMDELMAAVQGNPIIAKLIEQVEEINNGDNMVDNIFFSDESIVINTKEMITDGEISGHRRRIGRMQFEIGIRALVSGNTETNRPITITNLDRIYRGSGEDWACGHTPNRSAPCFGSAFEHLHHAFVERDLHSIVEVLIRFVRNPDPLDSWGRHIVNWPTVN